MNNFYLPKKKYLAAFDFDGTLTEGDTMIEFIRFLKGSAGLYRSYLALSLTLVMYKLKLISNEDAKKELLAWHFKGWETKKLTEKGKEFCEKILPGMIREGAKKRLSWHREQGHTMAVVTSSLEWWVKPWCDLNGMSFIGTLPASDNGIFNGEFSSPNCYGPEKVRRLEESLGLKNFDFLYAYGDTKGDREMLQVADQSYFKPFR